MVLFMQCFMCANSLQTHTDAIVVMILS